MSDISHIVNLGRRILERDSSKRGGKAATEMAKEDLLFAAAKAGAAAEKAEKAGDVGAQNDNLAFKDRLGKQLNKIKSQTGKTCIKNDMHDDCKRITGLAFDEGTKNLIKFDDKKLINAEDLGALRNKRLAIHDKLKNIAVKTERNPETGKAEKNLETGGTADKENHDTVKALGLLANPKIRHMALEYIFFGKVTPKSLGEYSSTAHGYANFDKNVAAAISFLSQFPESFQEKIRAAAFHRHELRDSRGFMNWNSLKLTDSAKVFIKAYILPLEGIGADGENIETSFKTYLIEHGYKENTASNALNRSEENLKQLKMEPLNVTNADGNNIYKLTDAEKTQFCANIKQVAQLAETSQKLDYAIGVSLLLSSAANLKSAHAELSASINTAKENIEKLQVENIKISNLCKALHDNVQLTHLAVGNYKEFKNIGSRELIGLINSKLNAGASKDELLKILEDLAKNIKWQIVNLTKQKQALDNKFQEVNTSITGLEQSFNKLMEQVEGHLDQNYKLGPRIKAAADEARRKNGIDKVTAFIQELFADKFEIADDAYSSLGGSPANAFIQMIDEGYTPDVHIASYLKQFACIVGGAGAGFVVGAAVGGGRANLIKTISAGIVGGIAGGVAGGGIGSKVNRAPKKLKYEFDLDPNPGINEQRMENIQGAADFFINFSNLAEKNGQFIDAQTGRLQSSVKEYDAYENRFTSCMSQQKVFETHFREFVKNYGVQSNVEGNLSLVSNDLNRNPGKAKAFRIEDLAQEMIEAKTKKYSLQQEVEKKINQLELGLPSEIDGLFKEIKDSGQVVTETQKWYLTELLKLHGVANEEITAIIEGFEGEGVDLNNVQTQCKQQLHAAISKQIIDLLADARVSKDEINNIKPKLDEPDLNKSEVVQLINDAITKVKCSQIEYLLKSEGIDESAKTGYMQQINAMVQNGAINKDQMEEIKTAVTGAKIQDEKQLQFIQLVRGLLEKKAGKNLGNYQEYKSQIETSLQSNPAALQLFKAVVDYVDNDLVDLCTLNEQDAQIKRNQQQILIELEQNGAVTPIRGQQRSKRVNAIVEKLNVQQANIQELGAISKGPSNLQEKLQHLELDEEYNTLNKQQSELSRQKNCFTGGNDFNQVSNLIKGDSNSKLNQAINPRDLENNITKLNDQIKIFNTKAQQLTILNRLVTENAKKEQQLNDQKQQLQQTKANCQKQFEVLKKLGVDTDGYDFVAKNAEWQLFELIEGNAPEYKYDVSGKLTHQIKSEEELEGNLTTQLTGIGIFNNDASKLLNELKIRVQQEYQNLYTEASGLAQQLDAPELSTGIQQLGELHNKIRGFFDTEKPEILAARYLIGKNYFKYKDEIEKSEKKPFDITYQKGRLEGLDLSAQTVKDTLNEMGLFNQYTALTRKYNSTYAEAAQQLKMKVEILQKIDKNDLNEDGWHDVGEFSTKVNLCNELGQNLETCKKGLDQQIIKTNLETTEDELQKSIKTYINTDAGYLYLNPHKFLENITQDDYATKIDKQKNEGLFTLRLDSPQIAGQYFDAEQQLQVIEVDDDFDKNALSRSFIGDARSTVNQSVLTQDKQLSQMSQVSGKKNTGELQNREKQIIDLLKTAKVGHQLSLSSECGIDHPSITSFSTYTKALSIVCQHFNVKEQDIIEVSFKDLESKYSRAFQEQYLGSKQSDKEKLSLDQIKVKCEILTDELLELKSTKNNSEYKIRSNSTIRQLLQNTLLELFKPGVGTLNYHNLDHAKSATPALVDVEQLLASDYQNLYQIGQQLQLDSIEVDKIQQMKSNLPVMVKNMERLTNLIRGEGGRLGSEGREIRKGFSLKDAQEDMGNTQRTIRVFLAAAEAWIAELPDEPSRYQSLLLANIQKQITILSTVSRETSSKIGNLFSKAASKFGKEASITATHISDDDGKLVLPSRVFNELKNAQKSVISSDHPEVKAKNFNNESNLPLDKVQENVLMALGTLSFSQLLNGLHKLAAYDIINDNSNNSARVSSLKDINDIAVLLAIIIKKYNIQNPSEFLNQCYETMTKNDLLNTYHSQANSNMDKFKPYALFITAACKTYIRHNRLSQDINVGIKNVDYTSKNEVMSDLMLQGCYARSLSNLSNHCLQEIIFKDATHQGQKNGNILQKDDFWERRVMSNQDAASTSKPDIYASQSGDVQQNKFINARNVNFLVNYGDKVELKENINQIAYNVP